MQAVFKIRRLDPERSPEPYWEEYEVECEAGAVVLYALHDIHDAQDGTLAYRYSCRGAICGSCAIRINGTAALACKTQVSTLDTSQPIVLEPLLNSDVIKDLVVDQGPFFAALRTTMPWLEKASRDPHEDITPDDETSKAEKDQFLRSADCIMCQSCFSDCPKRGETADFIGPAACLAGYRRTYHELESDPDGRLKAACVPGGVYDCDHHANCVKVCPKDCRPMRAITFLQQRAKKRGLAPQ